MCAKVKARADQLVFEQGLTGSREQARRLIMAGKVAVENAVNGINGRMIGFERGIQNGKYACRTKLVPLVEVANVEKKIPREWINEEGNGVNHQFIEYALPLIQGEPELPKQDSLPRFVKLKKVLAK